jgi:hypothetical protein
MDKLIQLFRSTLCVFMLVCSAAAFAGQNILYYSSEPGDYIGQGAEVTFTGADAPSPCHPTTPTVHTCPLLRPVMPIGGISTSPLPTTRSCSQAPMKMLKDGHSRQPGIQASTSPGMAAAAIP